MKPKRRMYLPFLAIACIILLDQLTKYWAATVLIHEKTIELIPNVFSLTYATNNGAAWSMFAGQRVVLLIVSVLALILIGVTLLRGWIDTAFGRWGVYLVLGGAFGNFIDRLFRDGGYVVDLFEFRFIDFPIFNVADIFICTGGVLFGLYVVISATKDYRRGGLKKDGTEEDSDEE